LSAANNYINDKLTVKPASWHQMLLTTEPQLFLFDSNTIEKKQLDFIAAKHLHKNEINILQQRKKPQAQREFIISRILIKQLFARGSNKHLHQIEIKFNEQKLRLELFFLDILQPISVCLSHSKGVVLIALSLSDIALGVDIEYINSKRDVQSLAKNFYHSTEVEQVKQNGFFAFYRIWTLKEAISKLFKQPIVITLKQNIFEQLPLLIHQSGKYKEFDFSFVIEKTYQASSITSINSIEAQIFLNSLTNTTKTYE